MGGIIVNAMKYIRETDKGVAEALSDLQEAVARNGFGVLHVYDLKKTLEIKGVLLNEECHILEICNPHKAKAVLDTDMSLNMALPCRISVYTEKGRTKIGMISPKKMLAALSNDPVLAKIAAEVEATSRKIIEEAL